MSLRFSVPLFLLLAACHGRGSAEDPPPANYSVSAGKEAGSVIVRTDQGSATVRSGDAQAALPSGLGLYPGASVASSTIVTPEGAARGSATLSFRSADAAPAIAAWYKTGAARAGYAIESEVTTPELVMIGGKRADGADFSLTIVPAGGGAEATLNAGTVPSPTPAPGQPARP